MVARNDITGDAIQTKGVSEAYRDNYDKIFGKKEKKTIDEVSKLIAEETLDDTDVTDK
jgi:hypothetical protein